MRRPLPALFALSFLAAATASAGPPKRTAALEQALATIEPG